MTLYMDIDSATLADYLRPVIDSHVGELDGPVLGWAIRSGIRLVVDVDIAAAPGESDAEIFLRENRAQG